MIADLKPILKHKESGLAWLGQMPLMKKGGIEPFIRREVLPYTPDQIDLWQMLKFYETDRGEQKLSTLLRESPWADNRLAEAAAALDKRNQGDDAP